MAPEVLTSDKSGYTQSSDMWSVGVLAFMLLAGHMPFESRIEAIVVSQQRRGHRVGVVASVYI
jgi:serine/threonine protein kinase